MELTQRSGQRPNWSPIKAKATRGTGGLNLRALRPMRIQHSHGTPLGLRSQLERAMTKKPNEKPQSESKATVEERLDALEKRMKAIESKLATMEQNTRTRQIASDLSKR